MTHFYNRLPFPPDSRMTGIWSNSWVDEPVGDEVAIGHLINFPDNQDAGLESDFLSSHMPFNVGGFSGVYPDGSPWMFILQKAPADVSKRLMREEDPHWLMRDSLQRALRFNHEARIVDELTWTRGKLEFAYALEGIDTDDIADWTMADLIRGLLTECCYVELSDIVDRHAAGCAFPDIEHDCAGDVFTDVFARWGVGLLQRPEPQDNDNDNMSDEDLAREPLEGKTLRDLKKDGLASGFTAAEMKGLDIDGLIDLLVGDEDESDEDSDDDDDDVDLSLIGLMMLHAMSRSELEVLAKECGIRVRRSNSKKHRSRKRLIALIMDVVDA